MKKSLKKLVALAVLLISGTSCIFADVSDYVNKMYAKVDIGYRGGTPNVLTSYYDYFTICPTFGFCPVSDFQNLVAEISLDMNFSQPKSGPVQKVTDIIPAIMSSLFALNSSSFCSSIFSTFNIFLLKNKPLNEQIAKIMPNMITNLHIIPAASNY